jgi:SAM-dependent methyltransferase
MAPNPSAPNPSAALNSAALNSAALNSAALNPPTQYADDRNLRARQRLWRHQSSPFDIVGWVLELAGLAPNLRVLDVGCGNGAYLRAMRDRPVRVVGCDLSLGMLQSVSHPALLNADVVALPVRDGAFDVVLAPHMLYHVPDRESAARELRRALVPGGVCVVVTNGARHLRSLRDLVELAVGEGTPGWEMRSAAAHAFSIENGAAQLCVAFESVTCVRPERAEPVIIRDARVVAEYVASMAGHYQDEVARPWPDIVADVRQAVQKVIDEEGAFVTSGDSAAFLCR